MSTTYWAVSKNGAWLALERGNPHWTTSAALRLRFGSREQAAGASSDLGEVELRKFRRYTREESRARAEARGEVRALEHLGPYATGETAKLTRVELQRLLTDARTRAGIR